MSRLTLTCAVGLALTVPLSVVWMTARSPAPGVTVRVVPAANDSNAPDSIRTTRADRAASTADHAKFEQLQREFATGPDVTAACLECHTEAAQQIMRTSHWTWICPKARQELAEKQDRPFGKGEQIINNFCIALGSNEPRCTSCHAGYGWEDKSFDFNEETRVDCLVCHDTTRTYKKFPTDAGHPVYKPKEWPKGSGNMWQPPDLAHIAQNVGKPSRHNCGACHFFGGGGEGVKHGDMDVTLDHPTMADGIDVHMATDGQDFHCIECHTTREHRIAGRCFTIPATDQRAYIIKGANADVNFLACESCHNTRPHADKKLNDHTDRVSCQACHIPTMAPKKATKMWWDWSQAGENTAEGKPRVEKVEIKGEKVLSYHKKKGAFVWARDEVPEYRWFNGNVSHVFLGDVIDDATPGRTGSVRYPHRDAAGDPITLDKLDLDKPVVEINALEGSPDDPASRIWPVKVHRGIQPYDTELKTLVVPKLFGKDKAAYWKGFDWDAAIVAGMDYVGQPYSGEYGWIQTEMYWPLAHMVRPADQALSCVECHHADGRLGQLAGFYMPGRDHSRTLDRIGLALIAGAIGLSLLHGVARVVTGKGGSS